MTTVTPLGSTVAIETAALGIDVGGSSIKWALVTPDGIPRFGRVATPRSGERDVLSAIAGIAAAVSEITNVTGLAIPGPIPAETEPLFIPNIPGRWEQVDLRDELREVTETVVLSNDAIAFAEGEFHGAAHGASDVLFLTLGTGVGGAIGLDGRVHRGVLGRAGEIGHMVVEPDGLSCVCGNRGCLETLASATAVSRAAVDCLPGEERTAADLATVARSGDEHAREIFRRAGRAIGIAIGNCCSVFAPELVVIGGGMAAALDLLVPSIEAVLAPRSAFSSPPEIVPCALGEHAGAVGAAAAAARAVQA